MGHSQFSLRQFEQMHHIRARKDVRINARAFMLSRKTQEEWELEAAHGTLKEDENAQLQGGVTARLGTMTIKLEDIAFETPADGSPKAAYSDQPVTVDDPGTVVRVGDEQWPGTYDGAVETARAALESRIDDAEREADRRHEEQKARLRAARAELAGGAS